MTRARYATTCTFAYRPSFPSQQRVCASFSLACSKAYYNGAESRARSSSGAYLLVHREARARAREFRGRGETHAYFRHRRGSSTFELLLLRWSPPFLCHESSAAALRAPGDGERSFCQAHLRGIIFHGRPSLNAAL